MKKIVHPRAAKTSDVFVGSVYDVTLYCKVLSIDYEECIIRKLGMKQRITVFFLIGTFNFQLNYYFFRYTYLHLIAYRKIAL